MTAEYNREQGTKDWIEKFKQELIVLESQKENMHPVKYKLGVNSINGMVADLEQQLARKVQINVNGIDVLYFDKTIGYEEIFYLAYGKQPKGLNFSCMFSNPGLNTGGGIISPNGSHIIPKEGMKITIIDTSNA